jgi:predicted nucleic acid-binding protein
VIFLGKIDQLGLLTSLYSAPVLVADQVRAEILAGDLPPAEERAVQAFLSACVIRPLSVPGPLATGLSPADSATLALAMAERDVLLIADDHLVRDVARAEGIRRTGTLGVLLRACAMGRLSSAAVQRLVDELIQEHRFRIGIEVYDALVAQLRSF